MWVKFYNSQQFNKEWSSSKTFWKNCNRKETNRAEEMSLLYKMRSLVKCETFKPILVEHFLLKFWKRFSILFVTFNRKKNVAYLYSESGNIPH